jgi:hypothetical protein
LLHDGVKRKKEEGKTINKKEKPQKAHRPPSWRVTKTPCGGFSGARTGHLPYYPVVTAVSAALPRSATGVFEGELLIMAANLVYQALALANGYVGVETVLCPMWDGRRGSVSGRLEFGVDFGVI